MRHRLASTKGLAYARKRIAERLGEMTREQGGELRERRAALDKIEQQIAKVVDFVTQGFGTKTVSERLKSLEREAESERKALAVLEAVAATPIKLPAPDEMLRIVFDLERPLTADVTRGREELRHLFRDGRIDLVPQKDGFYIARSEILPLVLLTKPTTSANRGGRKSHHEESRYSAFSCAGALRTLEHDASSSNRGVGSRRARFAGDPLT